MPDFYRMRRNYQGEHVQILPRLSRGAINIPGLTCKKGFEIRRFGGIDPMFQVRVLHTTKVQPPIGDLGLRFTMNSGVLLNFNKKFAEASLFLFMILDALAGLGWAGQYYILCKNPSDGKSLYKLGSR